MSYRFQMCILHLTLCIAVVGQWVRTAVRSHTFVEIISLALIQEGQLSVTDESTDTLNMESMDTLKTDRLYIYLSTHDFVRNSMRGSRNFCQVGSGPQLV